MRKIAYLAGAAIAMACLSAPGLAAGIVVGGSLGAACYEAALNKANSFSAIVSCDYALKSGTMSAHDTVATYVNRGILKLARDDFDDAVRDFDRAIALDPAEPESYLNKGTALLRKGADPSLAVAQFDEALERGTQRPELAYFSRAIAYETAGDVKAAYQDYRRAQLAAPDWDSPARELSRFEVRKTVTSRL